MNILFWILQALLAFHTAMGAVWKLTNPEQGIPSLAAIPHFVWLLLIVVELAVVVGLILPAFKKSLGRLAPYSAIVIAAEMLFFTLVNLVSGATDTGQITYWLVVAVICGFLAWGRLVLKPIE